MTEGILAQLLEKKDVLIYIDVRSAHLRRKDITEYPEQQREMIAERLKGRLKELEMLKSLINSGRLKDADKQYWQENFENED